MQHSAISSLRSLERSKTFLIPPTASVLLEHTERAAFQAGHIWGHCLVAKLFPCQVIGVGRSVMDNGELYGPHYLRPPRLLLRIALLQVQEDLQWDCKCHRADLQCSSMNYCALAMNSVMETELIVRPDTNSALHAQLHV